MNFWDILGIPPESDLSAVKKAYAKKLKIHHPEDDPEGYQLLREAYDAAVKAAKRTARLQTSQTVPPAVAEENHSKEDVPDSEEWEEEEWVRQPPRLRFPQMMPEEQGNDFPSADRLFAELKSLYDDFSLRIEPASWGKLLPSSLLWDLRLMERVRQRMIYFLKDHPHLPQQVWELLEGMFQWKEWEEELHKRHSDQVLEQLFLRFGSSWELPYHFIVQERVADNNVDGFLRLRKLAFCALQENGLAEAETFITQGLSLYQKDPAMLGLYAELLERKGLNAEALQICTQILSLDPGNAGMYYRRAKLLHPADREAAMADCRAALALEPDHAAAVALLAACCDELGEHAAANEYYLRVLQLAPNHVYARLYFSRREGLIADTPEPGIVKLYKPKRSLAGAAGFVWRPFLTRALPCLLAVLLIQLFAVLTDTPLGIADIVSDSPRHRVSAAQTAAVIRSADDWLQFGGEGTKVRLDLPPGGYLGNVLLYQFHLTGKTLYVTKEEGERLRLFDKYSFNYVLIGLLQGKAVPMVIEDYQDAKALFDNNALSVNGVLEPVPSDMLNGLLSRMKFRKVQLPEGMLEKGLYLDNTRAGDAPASTLPLSTGIVTVQLLLLVLFSIEISRIGRTFGITRWHVPGKEHIWQNSGWSRM